MGKWEGSTSAARARLRCLLVALALTTACADDPLASTATEPSEGAREPTEREPPTRDAGGETAPRTRDAATQETRDASRPRADAAKPAPMHDAASPSPSPSADAASPSADAMPPSVDDAAAPSTPSVLPSIEDPGMPGPFGAEQVATAPGLSSHTLFVPAKLGEQGVKHPIIVWTNGATGSTNFYQKMLEHFASHGFFVVADKMSGGNHDPEIVSQKAGIDWAIAEAARTDSPYFGKIDPDRLGIAGHSLGAVASFANTGHPRVKASIHWSGSLTGNPVGADEAWLQQVHAPLAILCGGAEPRALPRCSGDFDNAPAGVPVFYGTVAGVGHTDVFGERNGGQWGRAGVAFWRLTLADDESFRDWFRGPDCTLCESPWTGKSRGF